MPIFQTALCWWAATLTDHFPNRVGWAKIFPLQQVTLLPGMYSVTLPFSPELWSLILVGHQPHVRQGWGGAMAGGSGRRRHLLTFQTGLSRQWWRLGSVVCGGGMRHVALAARVGLSKRGEEKPLPATSSRTFAPIVTPLAVILHTCLFTLTSSPWPWTCFSASCPKLLPVSFQSS